MGETISNDDHSVHIAGIALKPTEFSSLLSSLPQKGSGIFDFWIAVLLEERGFPPGSPLVDRRMNV
jgi:hypothetical protein